MKNKKECLVFGATGKISKIIIEILNLNNFFIHGVSKKSNQKVRINNYKHYFFDINKKLSRDIKKVLSSKNLKFIIFLISKKEPNKDLEFDTKILMDYHLFFPLKIANKIKNKKINLILINSNCIFSNTSKFPYSVSKLAAAYFIRYSNKLFPNLKFFSILMGKLRKKNIKNLRSLIKKLINNSSQYKSRNFLIERKKTQLKLY